MCFRVREGGSSGSTLVLFADGPNALEHHDAIFDRLAQWSGVVAVDPPGFGFSTPESNFDFTLRAFADAYAALLTALGRGPYVLCPTCTNVYPVALIAAEHPDLVSHVVLMQALEWDQERIWTSKIVDPNGDLARPYAGQTFNYQMRAAAAEAWYPNALGDSAKVTSFLRQWQAACVSAFQPAGACGLGSQRPLASQEQQALIAEHRATRHFRGKGRRRSFPGN